MGTIHTCTSMPSADRSVPVAGVGRGRQGAGMAVDGNGGPMQPLDDEPQSPAEPLTASTPPGATTDAMTQGAPIGAEPAPATAAPAPAEPASAAAEPDKTQTPMAAFDRLSMKWLVSAGAVVVALIVAVVAVLVLGPAR